MTREEKIQGVVTELQNKILVGYTVEHYESLKNNNVTLNGIMIREKDETICPVIYIDNYLDDYSIEEIVDIVLDIYNQFGYCPSALKNISEVIGNYTYAKDKLSIILINKAANEQLLRSIPHEDFLDLAIVVVVNLSDEALIKVSNEMLASWDKPFDEILQTAKENFYADNIYFKSINEVFEDNGIMGMEAESSQMYVLTNRQNQYGAGFITNNKIMEYISGKLQSDLLVFPSSVNEVIILPSNLDVSYDEMSEIIQIINEKEVSAEEILSDHVYIYRRQMGWN